MNTITRDPRSLTVRRQHRMIARNLAARRANERAMQGSGYVPDAPGVGPEAWTGLFNAGLILITVVLIVVAALKVLP